MIVTLFSSRVPRPMWTSGPITENGPISTSQSISARGWIDTFSAMNPAIPLLLESLSFKRGSLLRGPAPGLDHFFLVQKRPHQFRVQPMSTAIGDDVADHVAARQGQIADQVQRLVTHAL